MRKALCLFFTLLSLNVSAVELTLEGGVVQNPYNRVAVPGDDGTQFSLAEALDESYFYHRVNIANTWGRHGVRLLYAPLNVTGSATYSKDIDFLGVNFPQDEKISFEYQFNSYRATYFYQVDQEGPWKTRMGITTKVRDAKIKLKQGGQSKVKRNSGLVPLFYLFSEYRFQNGLRLAFDFDGWVAPQGRALDAGIMAGVPVRENIFVSLGYRVLEGGADNDNVLNFSRLDYFFSSLHWEF